MDTLTRPQAPQADVLATARQAAVDLTTRQLRAETRWLVGEAIHRPQSTLFPLQLFSGDEPLLHAYYKVHRIEDAAAQGQAEVSAEGKMASIRRVLSHGTQMAERFRERAGDIPVAVAQILAIDLDRLTEVQVVLPGRALTRLGLHRVPGRRADALQAYRLFGQAIAIIESLEPPVPGTPGSMISQTALVGLEPRMPPQEFSRVVAQLETLEREVLQTSPTVCAHGDINSSHILWAGSGVGLVDLLWATRWRGQDLVEQSNHLHAEVIDLPRWTAELEKEMALGYGDPSLPMSPQWRLSQLSALTKGVASSGTGKVARYRQRRAARRLSALVAE